MLLAVEGGGFFSSSASGYSKGLTLLLLGQKKEEKQMRVTPWNQYQLVDQETDPDIPLASAKNRLVCGCASFVCFGSATAGLDCPSPLKVGPTQEQEVLQEVPVPVKDKDQICSADIDSDENSTRRISFKSSLRKSKVRTSVSGDSAEAHEALSENSGEVGRQLERRKVQWTDISGGELVEIREFEPRPRIRKTHDIQLEKLGSIMPAAGWLEEVFVSIGADSCSMRLILPAGFGYSMSIFT